MFASMYVFDKCACVCLLGIFTEPSKFYNIAYPKTGLNALVTQLRISLAEIYSQVTGTKQKL